MSGQKLACGCVRGEFLCPEAVALWAEVNRAYGASAADGYSEQSWAKYEEAGEEYRRHYKEERDADRVSE